MGKITTADLTETNAKEDKGTYADKETDVPLMSNKFSSAQTESRVKVKCL